MKRIWMAAAVGLAVSAGAAQADFGGPFMPMPQRPMPAAGPTPAEQAQNVRDRYGLHPMIRRVVWWKPDEGCANCAPKNGGMPAGGYGMPGGYGMAGPYGAGGWGGMPGQPGMSPGMSTPGTLVFPHHWYARSPRDFFMVDAPRR